MQERGKKDKAFTVNVEDDLELFILRRSNELSEVIGEHVKPSVVIRRILRKEMENSELKSKNCNDLDKA